MAETGDATKGPDDVALLGFFRSIASRDPLVVRRMLYSSYELAPTPAYTSRPAYERATAELLIEAGASVRARNRRGAEPLHYAANGIPGRANWDPGAQHAVIECLIARGADPNACDHSGVAPLHRAVRTRCSATPRSVI